MKTRWFLQVSPFDRQAVYDDRSLLPQRNADFFFSLTTQLDLVQNSTKCRFQAICRIMGRRAIVRDEQFLLWLFCKAAVIPSNHWKLIMFAVAIVSRRLLCLSAFMRRVSCISPPPPLPDPLSLLLPVFICSGRWVMRQQDHVTSLPITSIPVPKSLTFLPLNPHFRRLRSPISTVHLRRALLCETPDHR